MSVELRRTNAYSGVPLTKDDVLVKLKICPDCQGRGWFLINPFATGDGGFGGIGNFTQCTTCFQAHEYFKQHGKLPDELAKLMEVAS